MNVYLQTKKPPIKPVDYSVRCFLLCSRCALTYSNDSRLAEPTVPLHFCVTYFYVCNP